MARTTHCCVACGAEFPSVMWWLEHSLNCAPLVAAPAVRGEGDTDA